MQTSTTAALFSIDRNFKLQQGMIFNVSKASHLSLLCHLYQRQGWGGEAADQHHQSACATSLHHWPQKPYSQQKEQKRYSSRPIFFSFSLSILSCPPAHTWFRFLSCPPKEQGKEPGWLADGGLERRLGAG